MKRQRIAFCAALAAVVLSLVNFGMQIHRDGWHDGYDSCMGAFR